MAAAGPARAARPSLRTSAARRRRPTSRACGSRPTHRSTSRAPCASRGRPSRR
jgi:hypothetical protein